MEATNLDKIKTKLQKLMRLYNGAKAINSEGEANAAAAAIQRLPQSNGCLLSTILLWVMYLRKNRRRMLSKKV